MSAVEESKFRPFEYFMSYMNLLNILFEYVNSFIVHKPSEFDVSEYFWEWKKSVYCSNEIFLGGSSASKFHT